MSGTELQWDRRQTALLVGAAGSGMRALARVLLDRGWRVIGSDQRSEPGAPFPWRTGHSEDNLPSDCRLVIFSDAIALDCPELTAARGRGLPVIRYIEAVARLLAAPPRPRVFAVAGTHGKSTTTAMLGKVFEHAGRDPTVFCGATPLGGCWGAGGRTGGGPWAVVEACEWNRNFLNLDPQAAIILNIELDHLDTYPDEGALLAAFTDFAQRVPSDGLLALGIDSPLAVRLLSRLSQRRVVTFGFGQADWSAAANEESGPPRTFRVMHRGRKAAEVRLRLAGRHHVLNALAALAAAVESGLDARQAAEALAEFSGLERRMEHLGRHRDVEFYDDFAHHPTEIVATLTTLRQLHPHRRLVCVFQPHQRRRTIGLLDEFAQSLAATDLLAITEVFAARERPGAGPDNAVEELRRRVRGPASVVADSPDRLPQTLAEALTAGDLFVTLGAGDIRRLADDVRRRWMAI